jgi:hypothetical protein
LERDERHGVLVAVLLDAVPQFEMLYHCIKPDVLLCPKICSWSPKYPGCVVRSTLTRDHPDVPLLATQPLPGPAPRKTLVAVTWALGPETNATTAVELCGQFSAQIHRRSDIGEELSSTFPHVGPL